MDDLPGLDLSRLTLWLNDSRPGLLTAPLEASMIAGGKSNLTYRLTDGAATWALRRPPLGHVLPSAHDMAREFRVISSLATVQIPVPRPVVLCSDASVLGAPFYLMDFVDGVVVDTAAAVAAVKGESATRLGEALIDSLLALHQVDPVAAGLADFGKPVGFLQRQLVRWQAQWQASASEAVPAEVEVVRLLTEALPVSGPPTVVHGDFRLTNVIFNPALDAVAAIVDWEMATLGDPLADLGLLYVYHDLALTDDTIMPLMIPGDGFLSPRELIARYRRASDRELSALDWYIAFGYFKLAVIAEGIAARHRQGKTVGAGFANMGAIVSRLLASALATLSG